MLHSPVLHPPAHPRFTSTTNMQGPLTPAQMHTGNADARLRAWCSGSAAGTRFAGSSSSMSSSSSTQQKQSSSFERLKSVPVTVREESLADKLRLDCDLVELFGPWNAPRLTVMRDTRSLLHLDTHTGRQEHGGRCIVRDARLHESLKTGAHGIFDSINSPRVSVTSDTELFWRAYAKSMLRTPRLSSPSA